MQDFDSVAETLENAHRSLLWQRAELANYAEARRLKSRLAHLWFCSSMPITKLAELWREVPEEWHEVDLPEQVFKAAVAIAKEYRKAKDAKPWKYEVTSWLRLAHRYGWHQRQLKDAAGKERGERVSRVKLLNDHEADVFEWKDISNSVLPGDPVPYARIELGIPGWTPSGEPPQKVRITAVEVLQNE